MTRPSRATAAAFVLLISASARAQSGPTGPVPELPPAAGAPQAPPSDAAVPVEAVAEPAPAVVSPAPTVVMQEPALAAPAPDDAAARRVLQAHASRARTSRQIGGVAMLIGGAGLVGAGLLADLEYDQRYGQLLWIAGAVTGVGGVLSLVKASPLESFAGQADGASAPAIRSHWGSMARAAKSTRKISGVVSLVLGGVAATAGTMIAAGVGDLDRADKQDLSIALLAVTGGLLGNGLSSLFIESDIETGYRSAYGADPSKPFTVGFSAAPTRGGAAAGLSVRW